MSKPIINPPAPNPVAPQATSVPLRAPTPLTHPSYAQLLRRRAVPLASAAAATLSMAGCGMAPVATAPAMINPDQRVADQQVRAFTSDIESALDTVDRDRLRAAAEKKGQGQTTAVPLVTTVTPLVTPAVTPTVVQSAPIAPSPAAQATAAVTPEPPASAPKTISPAAEPRVATATPAPAVAAPAPATLGPVAPAPVATASPAPVVAKPVAETPPQTVAAQATPRVAAPASPPAAAIAAPAASSEVAMPPASPPAAAPDVATITPTAHVQTPASAMGAMNAIIVPTEALPSEAAGSPISTPSTPSAEPTVEDALSVIRRRIAAHPTVNTALALARLDTAESKNSNGDLAKKLPDSDQKVLSDLISALENMQNPQGTALTLSERTAPLLDAAKKWQGEADLALPKLVLATRVDSFGVYTAIEPRFEQGKRHTVIIYCEVANFASKKGDDGWFSTHLTQQETLITDDGLLVWRPNAEDVEDRSLNQRHDFYLVKKLTIPETLASGKYTLRMSVTDKTTGKISLMSLPVEIVNK